MEEKLEAQVELKSSAEKVHEVFSCRPHHINTMSPSFVHGVDLHEGQFGKHGSVICWTYNTHDGVKKVAKEIVEEIDDVNYSTKYKVIEGEVLEHYKHFRLIVKATPKEEGSAVNWTLEYERKTAETPHPNAILEAGICMTKDIDAHLINN